MFNDKESYTGLPYSVYNIMQEYWEELCKEFNVDVPLYIISKIEYLVDFILEDSSTVVNTSVSDFILSNTSGKRIFANCDVSKDLEDSVGLNVDNISVYATEEHIDSLIFYNIENLDNLYIYLKLMLRHEMGHVLDYMSYPFRFSTWDEYIKYLTDIDGEYVSRSSEYPTADYYNCTPERIANGLTKIAISELVDAQNNIDVYTVCIGFTNNTKRYYGTKLHSK